MKHNIKIFLLLAILASSFSEVRSQVLQIFEGRSYNPVELDNLDVISFDLDKDLMILQESNGNTKSFKFNDSSNYVIGKSIPLINLTTTEYVEEISSKTTYLEGTFFLQGFGEFEDIERDVNIRGRGNSSWEFIKKPYRLKFDKKVSLCGLPSAKNYVLLANFMDCSLIQNALAFKIGAMLGLPYTNKAVPVDVVLNGIYKGSYLLTNKPGINAGSVDIDENNSIMWELDVVFDEDLKFKSPVFDLPVMVADPSEMDEGTFEYWKNDFIEMEKAVYNRKAVDYVDLEIAAKYLVVYEILRNDEIGYPKSFKMYKTKGKKYIFGPLWDFDVAMGKIWLGECYNPNKIDKPLWKNNLLSNLSLDPIFKEYFTINLKFIIDKIPELIIFIDDYSKEIRDSAVRNQMLYPEYEDFDQSVIKLKDWLKKRSEILKTLYSLMEIV